MNTKKRGRPKKEKTSYPIAISFRLSSEDRLMLRMVTKKNGNASDTDTIRRLIRKEALS